MYFVLNGGVMNRFLSIFVILSFLFSQGDYNVGDQISLQDQLLTKEVCFGHSLTTGDDFRLSDLNGDLNGGDYHVIFLDLSASW